MKRLAADDPVRVVRTVFREIYNHAIDQVLHQGIGWGGFLGECAGRQGI